MQTVLQTYYMTKIYVLKVEEFVIKENLLSLLDNLTLTLCLPVSSADNLGGPDPSGLIRVQTV